MSMHSALSRSPGDGGPGGLKTSSGLSKAGPAVPGVLRFIVLHDLSVGSPVVVVTQVIQDDGVADDMVDYGDLTTSLYTKFLYSLEEKAVDGHTYNPPIDDWDPLDVFQHYLVKEGGSYFTHLCFGFRGSSLDMAKLFITKYVLKESYAQNSKVPAPFNFVKSDETIPPGWIDLWKFLKRIFPYSRDNILMILL